jgi:hypothetical protein
VFSKHVSATLGTEQGRATFLSGSSAFTGADTLATKSRSVEGTPAARDEPEII